MASRKLPLPPVLDDGATDGDGGDGSTRGRAAEPARKLRTRMPLEEHVPVSLEEGGISVVKGEGRDWVTVKSP